MLTELLIIMIFFSQDFQELDSFGIFPNMILKSVYILARLDLGNGYHSSVFFNFLRVRNCENKFERPQDSKYYVTVSDAYNCDSFYINYLNGKTKVYEIFNININPFRFFCDIGPTDESTINVGIQTILYMNFENYKSRYDKETKRKLIKKKFFVTKQRKFLVMIVVIKIEQEDYKS